MKQTGKVRQFIEVVINLRTRGFPESQEGACGLGMYGQR